MGDEVARYDQAKARARDQFESLVNSFVTQAGEVGEMEAMRALLGALMRSNPLSVIEALSYAVSADAARRAIS
jgi:hypothetical protein